MQQLLQSLIAILCVTISVAQPRTVRATDIAITPPANWIAHPPIHLAGSAAPSPSGYAPNQVRHAYGFDRLRNDGAGQVIGIIDAFDDPTVGGDLQTFITTFGLRPMYGLPGAPTCTVAAGPHPCFLSYLATH